MNNTETLIKLKEIFTDLDKILDAAEEGKVPVWHDDNGNPTEWKDYTMSDNAYLDIVEVQQCIERIIRQFEGGF